MSHYRDLHLTHIAGKALHGGLVLSLTSRVEVLFDESQIPLALFDGEVFFPDEAFTRRSAALLNSFHPREPRTRVAPEDFQFMLASALMRNLRPMLRRQSQAEPPDATPSSEPTP